MSEAKRKEFYDLVNPAYDGYLYNGEADFELPREVAHRARSAHKAIAEPSAPPARSFIEIPIALPKPDWDSLTVYVPKPPTCDKCKEPRTHRYQTSTRMSYVCRSHARQASDEGYQIYGPQLSKT